MFPAEYPHQLHVVCNGGSPNPEVLDLFSETSPMYHHHDNSGWDIGAFEKFTAVDCDLILFWGANTHFKRAGWCTASRFARRRNRLGKSDCRRQRDVENRINAT